MTRLNLIRSLEIDIEPFTSLLSLAISSCLNWILLECWFSDVPVKVIYQVLAVHQHISVNNSSFTFRVMFWSYFVNGMVITNTRYNIDFLFPVASHLACSTSVSDKLCIKTLSLGSSVVRHGRLVFCLTTSFVFLSLKCLKASFCLTSTVMELCDDMLVRLNQ